jgi:hypothetical protein
MAEMEITILGAWLFDLGENSRQARPGFRDEVPEIET